MADDTTTSHPSDRPQGADRGPRPGGPREGGGFRIRLSDNEMQAARALQEAFGLRSTVAVLGFSLRTLAQQLENGELEELVARQRAQGGRPPAPRGRRREAGEGGGRGEGGARAARIDPFARPSRPAPAAALDEPAADSDAAEAPAAGPDESEALAPNADLPAESAPEGDVGTDATTEA